MPQAFLPQQMSFTLGQITLNLSLSFALAYLAATIYRKLYTGPAYSFSFFVTLLVIPAVVAMIMMAIGSNIALSLGLVGALSIIRFRTVIKDTRDMSFLFLMIGIGLCCGSGGYALAIIGTVFICIVLVAVHWIGRIRRTPSEYILVVRQTSSKEGLTNRAFEGMLSWYRLHAAADLGSEDGFEYTYRIRLSPTATPEGFLNRLRSVEGLVQPSLISPESQLAI